MADKESIPGRTHYAPVRLVDSNTARNLGITGERPLFLPKTQDHPVLSIGEIVPGSGIKITAETAAKNIAYGRANGFVAVFEPIGVLDVTRTALGFGQVLFSLKARELRILDIAVFCTEDDPKVHSAGKTGESGQLDNNPQILEGDIVISRRRLTQPGLAEGLLVPICGAMIHDRDPSDIRYTFTRGEDGSFQFFPQRGIKV